MTIVEKLLCGGRSHGTEFTQAGSFACQHHFLDVPSEAMWVEFCYVLKLSTRYAVSEIYLKELLHVPKLAAAYDWSRAIWLELQSNPWLFAACAGP